jgi:hypothetical protein
MLTRGLARAALVLLVLLAIAYSNHFQNGFHFDDSHAIVDNVFVRSVRYVPRYFTDATTFSVLPLNQSYRPVLQTTLAVDYRIAGGYKPLAFQIDSFAWYLLLLCAMFALLVPLAGSEWIALAAVAIFGLHPVCAETVNYIIQRGDILSAFGVVAALAVYVRKPEWRQRGVYLLPFVFGVLAKPPTLVFPVLLLLYLRLFEPRVRVVRALLPSVVLTLVGAWWLAHNNPPTVNTGASSPARYLLTQPFVALRYFAAFFAPVDLSADNDWPLVSGANDPNVFLGAAFLVAIGWAAARLSRTGAGKPIAFGLAWFVITLLPTSLTPLAEVANDHRMFLPFVGLALAAAVAGAWLIRRVPLLAPRPVVAGLVGVIIGVILVAEAAGVHARNEVWRTDQTLWHNVTEKSPQNGRGWMNYGVALMEHGDYAGAIAAYERALPLTPNYSLLHINLGVAYGGVRRDREADQQFLQAIQLAPLDWRSHVFYVGARAAGARSESRRRAVGGARRAALAHRDVARVFTVSIAG